LFARLKQDAEFHLDYLSSVGHQILTPLSALAGTLRSFEEGLLSENRLRERLPYVSGQVRVCARLVRNLSFMDKILRGERFEPRPQALARLAIETKLDLDHQLKAKRLALKIDAASLDRLSPVYGDRELLRQVLVNLLDNAVKYSVPGSTIAIRGYQWPAGRIVEISNRGLPISKENRERVFDRGFRTPQARAAVPHGTGLGLWLVQKILAAHDAQILCTEETESGASRTVFRITFPHSRPGRARRRSM
jgi:signal transduction histidine kinase